MAALGPSAVIANLTLDDAGAWAAIAAAVFSLLIILWGGGGWLKRWWLLRRPFRVHYLDKLEPHKSLTVTGFGHQVMRVGFSPRLDVRLERFAFYFVGPWESRPRDEGFKEKPIEAHELSPAETSGTIAMGKNEEPEREPGGIVTPRLIPRKDPNSIGRGYMVVGPWKGTICLEFAVTTPDLKASRLYRAKLPFQVLGRGERAAPRRRLLARAVDKPPKL